MTETLGHERPRLFGQFVGLESKVQREVYWREGQRGEHGAKHPLHFLFAHLRDRPRAMGRRRDRRVACGFEVGGSGWIEQAGTSGCTGVRVLQ